MDMSKKEYANYVKRHEPKSPHLKNFVKAIEKGTPLLAPGEEGIFGLSISNAAHLSAWTDQWVEPMNIDEDKFYNMLIDKINNSTFKKEEKATVYEDIRETHV